MPNALWNSRSRRNHRGLSNSRNHLAPRGAYHRRLVCEALEDRRLLSISLGDYVRVVNPVPARTDSGVGYAQITSAYYSSTYGLNP